jgi:hypothetical protein
LCQRKFGGGNKFRPASKIDRCIRNLISTLNTVPGRLTLSSCCGHGVYPMTIVVMDQSTGKVTELMSGKEIPRKDRFYKADVRGRYYIPEVSKPIVD